MADDTQKQLKELLQARSHDRKRAVSRRKRREEKEPERFAQVLHRYFKRDPFIQFRIEQTRAILAWERVVGEAAARVSTPLRIRGHRMIVQVTNPLWKQQLLLLKNQIISEYHRLFPKLKITEIFFVAE